MAHIRFASRLMVVLALLCLTACGQNTAATATPAPTATLPAPPTATPAPTAIPAPAHSTAVILATDGPTTGTQATTAPAATSAAVATTAPAGTAGITPTVVLGTATPDPLLKRPDTPTNIAGQIVFQSNTGALYLTKPDGKTPLRLSAEFDMEPDSSNARAFRLPSLSPNGKMIAAQGSGKIKGQVVSGIYLLNTDGSSITAGPQAIVEATDVTPIYYYWAPDSANLTFLQSKNQGPVQLVLSPARGTTLSSTTTPTTSSSTRILTSSAAVYSSWSPDSANLIFHAGGTHSQDATAFVGQIQTHDANSTVQKVNTTPGYFRAPAWAPDGKLVAYAVEVGDLQKDPKPESLVIQSPTGGTPEEIGRTGPGTVFNWSPAQSTLAVSWYSDPQNGIYGGIYLGKPGDKGTLDQIVTEDILAYYWSPDGKKIAYIAFSSIPGTPPLIWKVYDVAARKSQTVINFYPTQSFAQNINYFDQYSQSDRIWSPDSQAFVFAGWVGSDLNNGGEPADPKKPHVYIVGPNTRPRTLTEGEMGVWSQS